MTKVAWKARACVEGAHGRGCACGTIEAAGEQATVELLTVGADVAVWTVAVVLVLAVLYAVAVVQAWIGKTGVKSTVCANLSHFSDQSRGRMFTIGSIVTVLALAFVAESARLGANSAVQTRIRLANIFYKIKPK